MTTAPGQRAPVRRPRWSWALCLGAGVVSLVTMPITAIWFALLGPAIAILWCGLALAQRNDLRREQTVLTGGALAAGTFAGPAVYLGLSLLG